MATTLGQIGADYGFRAAQAVADAVRRDGLPPGPPWPGIVQLVRWIRWPTRVLRESSKRYGDIFTMRLPMFHPFVVFSDPEAVEEIFKGPPETFRAGEVNRTVMEPILGPHSLLSLDVPQHTRQRRLLMPPLHGERMHAYGDIMRTITEETMARWPEGRPFPIHTEMQHITLEVILRTVFGVDQGPRLTRLRDLLVELLAATASPLALLPIFQKDLGPLTPAGRTWATLREVDRILYEEIDARRTRGREGREDVLALLCDARDEDGSMMSRQELRDEMMTLLVAGHETSATTLSWVVHRLLEHPHVLARAREELDHVVGNAPLHPERVADLRYLEAIVKETMRLNPIIPAVGRRLSEPTRIGRVQLPAGAVAAPCIYLTHRRADCFPDPERFDPDRFLEKRVSPFAFYPFGGGIRRCVGMAMAMYEMKVVLATILPRFDLRKVPGQRIHLVRRSITFAPSEGMPVVVHRRG